MEVCWSDNLRYLVYADVDCRRLIAAFASHAEALSYLRLYVPLSGQIIDRQTEVGPAAGYPRH